MSQSQPQRRCIRVFVAETSPITCHLLSEAIARGGIDILGFSSTAVEVVQCVSSCPPDVLLISARMEEDQNCGFSVLQQLRVRLPGLKAVVLLDSSKPEGIVGAFRSGACGVFCRSTDIHVLRKCIAAVHEGQIWANSQQLGFVLAALATAQPFHLESKRTAPLSAREKEVVRCLVEGLTNREIAKTLLLSQHTVKNYIFKIFDKLGVSNRVELVLQVLSGANRFGPDLSSSLPLTSGPAGRAPAAKSASSEQLPSFLERPDGLGLPPRVANVQSRNLKAAS